MIEIDEEKEVLSYYPLNKIHIFLDSQRQPLFSLMQMEESCFSGFLSEEAKKESSSITSLKTTDRKTLLDLDPLLSTVSLLII